MSFELDSDRTTDEAVIVSISDSMDDVLEVHLHPDGSWYVKARNEGGQRRGVVVSDDDVAALLNIFRKVLNGDYES